MAAVDKARDERFATQARHLATPDPLHDNSQTPRALPIYQPSEFTYDAEARTCVCPAGKALYRKGHAGTDRYAGGPGAVCGAVRGGRAGVCESAVNKGLDRLTLRGRGKVDGQWQLFCLVQNIEKLAHHGYAT